MFLRASTMFFPMRLFSDSFATRRSLSFSKLAFVMGSFVCLNFVISASK